VAARIGVVPQIITGEREAGLSFAGATRGLGEEIFLVIDIGGGSTEFIRGPSQVDTAVDVDAVSLDAMSFDIGSVRLTDRVLVDRPAPPAQVAAARAMVDSIIASVPRASGASVLGVAGTFTSLAAMSLGLGGYDRTMVDGAVLTAQDLEACIEYLSALSIEETARIPSLHPRRAPVILAGAVIASASLAAVGAASVTVREADLLDALASELLD
jgi:exopolyphosphatase/guanosine-5'-triphosphate,3'-diphosphate pyrophosphatase